MDGFRRIFTWFVKIEIVASVLALVTICVLTLTVIAGRELFNASILWAEEVSLLMMKIVVFQGAAGIYAMRAFIVIDGLTEQFSDRWKWMVHLAGWLLVGLFAALVSYQGLLTYPSQISVRSYLLELPKFYFMVPLIIGTFSIAVTSLYYFLVILKNGPGEDAGQRVFEIRPFTGSDTPS